MKLSDTCIHRPVFATVLSLVVVLLGLVSYDRLTVREYPNIDSPVVNVSTTYPGASASIMESQVTRVLEESLAGIEGIDYMTSVSRQERSHITIVFDLDRDADSAAADVRDRVSRATRRLPEEIETPVIQKVEADAQPVLYLSFSSTAHNRLQLSDYADRYVKDQLQTLSGVAEVRIYGERRFAMRLWLDPMRLAGYNLTVQDVEDALRRQNVDIPAGLVEGRDREFTVLSRTNLQTVEQFDNLIIKQAEGYSIRLKDVGHAELAAHSERMFARYIGNNAITLGVVKQATANPLDVSREVRTILPEIERELPAGMTVNIGYDRSVFIEKSIENVYRTIAEAIALVVLIIFFFLRSLRATIIPIVTIPVSLIGTFALMFFFGFTINTLTLLALVLAIGLVVDDAIVMLENIYRYVEQGLSPVQAALKGSREIAFAVIAMTLTLAAVYVPIGFMTGKTGQLFTEFAWALAGAVLISGFVALTLSPMMCAKLLRAGHSGNILSRAIERFLDAMTSGYRRLLAVALSQRLLVVLIGLCVAGTGVFYYTLLRSELAPYEDQGAIMGRIVGPEGATIDYMDKYAQQLEEIYSRVPERQSYSVMGGWPTVSSGNSFIVLKPWEERERTAREIAQQLRGEMRRVPGIDVFPVLPAPLGQRGGSKAVEIVIQTTAPYEELDEMVRQVRDAVADYPGLVNVESDLELNKPQVEVSLDRDKAADLGINVDTVGRTLETMLGGRQVTRFEREGKQYDVLVQLARSDRSAPQDLENLYVRSAQGAMVPLSNIVEVKERVAPRELNHFNQLRSATLTANLGEGASLGEALARLETAIRDKLPSTVRIDYSGQSRDFKQAGAEIYLTFALALLFIYLVLSAQFESFIDPFIILLTVPLSIAGGLITLYYAGGTLNIYSQVGLVTLIGLISKHGILIVEFANHRRDEGRPVREAVLEAATLRLRPILMTTGAMVLGAVPLAIATGAGAESRHSIGWVIVGGISVGTFFTLFVIPAVYSLIRRDKQAPLAVQIPHQGALGETHQPAE
ncbi:efflux RND transporter permease subunit [Rhodoligotrophos defluvii]|uniref:efflux RND transporter permease subunit n=1 Tax=Rhodoligotrophos defluvii TaxID=2561934 RepID=UPI0010C9DB5F|nr:multidrug efflux RND transporter permease subunit [Rhodoligotrophos defluvii]